MAIAECDSTNTTDTTLDVICKLKLITSFLLIVRVAPYSKTWMFKPTIKDPTPVTGVTVLPSAWV